MVNFIQCSLVAIQLFPLFFEAVTIHNYGLIPKEKICVTV